MSTAEVTLKISLVCELPSTTCLQANDRLFLQVHKLDVPREVAWVSKQGSAACILAHQLLSSMSHRTLVDLKVSLAPKYLVTVAHIALDSLFQNALFFLFIGSFLCFQAHLFLSLGGI